jgi:tRNA (mo5U34)-methyltransferase
MIDHTYAYERLSELGLEEWSATLKKNTDQLISSGRFGDQEQWFSVLETLPQLPTSHINLNVGMIEVGKKEEASDSDREFLKTELMKLQPWRKGPFSFFGLPIDTEWRSDLKWDRLAGSISPLKGRRVLDIGCGSGYHVLRMLGQEAELVVGIEPLLRYCVQFYSLWKYVQNKNAAVFPLTLEQTPPGDGEFDTVFSMGILYHRKDPMEHLQKLRALTREGGEVILESLVIEGGAGEVLVPEGRYAKMRNVWNIPSTPTLADWLKLSGFKKVDLVDVNQTTTEEQHPTEWMGFESLKDFLDPKDINKTIEGHPAPKRALFIAK